jgi:hypothetical protein
VKLLAVVLLILAQRIQIGGPPSKSPVFTLTVEAVDRTGGSMQFVKVSLSVLGKDGAQSPVSEKVVDRHGQARFTDLPPGRYVLTGTLNAFIETRVGPIPLNPDTEIPSPLKLMLNEYGVF